VKKFFFSTEYRITPNRSYTTPELYELIKEKLGDKFGPITLETEKITKKDLIIAPGDKEYNIGVLPVTYLGGNGRIIVLPSPVETDPRKLLKKLKKPTTWEIVWFVLWVIMCVVTVGIWYLLTEGLNILKGILGIDFPKEYRVKIKELAQEIEKIVS